MIVINNGFNKFHLAPAASELARRGLLSAFCTGAYPTPRVKRWRHKCGLEGNRKLARLIARAEPINDDLVFVDWVPEALYVAGRALQKWALSKSVGIWAERKSFYWYGARAERVVHLATESSGAIYHYRGGFGHDSVRLAKRKGMLTLCDYSIAHPALLETLVTRREKRSIDALGRPVEGLWRDILEDAGQADAVLVNSDFVKDSFLRQGWDESRIHVIYLGVDDDFFDAIPPANAAQSLEEKPFRIVFAGGFEVRKGATVLAAAMKLLADAHQEFELHMAGGIGADATEELASLRRNARVHHHGTLSRHELAGLLMSADVFLFPSLAEGSARVVFEALACGSYVITTPNSGSIVEDGVHGRLVAPGDPEALAEAVREAMALGRQVLRQVGARNARVVREQYRQSHYGDRLVSLYSHLLGDSPLSARLKGVPPVAAERPNMLNTGQDRRVQRPEEPDFP